MKVLCVGEVLVDIIVNSVEEIPFENDTRQVESISVTSGGDANNNAVDLALLGNDVTYMGKISSDVLGNFLIKNAEGYGINMRYASRTGTPHAKSVILMNSRGDRTFLQNTSTSREFCFEDCDLRALEGQDIMQIAGTFHMPRFDGEGSAKLLRAAKERDILTSMDITSDRSGRWEDILLPCYPHLDFFLPSIEQASKLSRRDNPEEVAAYFLERGVKNVAVKLGSRGSYFCSRDQAFYIGCFEDLNVVETTGAGDAFCAGFLTGVGKGMDPLCCMTLATACSSFVIQAYGATAGMKDLATVTAFVESRPPLPVTYVR